MTTPQILSAMGLGLDLIGVLILGVDLWLLQNRLRREASDRMATVEEIVGKNGNSDGWFDDVFRRADWRQGDDDEGRWVPINGSFDYEAARDSFAEAYSDILELSKDMKVLAQITLASVNSDRRNANRSVWLTATGLGFICLGFSLQIAAVGLT